MRHSTNDKPRSVEAAENARDAVDLLRERFPAVRRMFPVRPPPVAVPRETATANLTEAREAFARARATLGSLTSRRLGRR